MDVRPADARERRRSREALKVDDDTVVILSLGRLSRHDKATLEPLLWAMAQVVHEGLTSAVRLIIAGEDVHQYSKELRHQSDVYGLSDIVAIRPDIDDSEKLRLIWGSDVFVGLFDSHQEVFGIAAAEAQASGLPSIVSDYSNIGRMVRDADAGITVPTLKLNHSSLEESWLDLLVWEEEHLLSSQLVVLDRWALKDALRTMIGSPRLRNRFGTNAKRQAADTYSMQAFSQKMMDIWRGCLTLGDATTATNSRSDPPSYRTRSELFADFATASVSVHDIEWFDSSREGSHEALIPPDLQAFVAPDCLTRVALVTRSLKSPARTHEIARRVGVSFDESFVALSLLFKYGFVQPTERSRS